MWNKISKFKKKFSNESQQIIVNTAWLYLDRILGKGLTLIVGVVVARYLGPTSLGILYFAAAIVELFSIIGKLGLDRLVIRDIVRQPADKNEILGTAFILKFVGSITALLLAVGTIYLLRPKDHLSVWLVAIIGSGSIFLAFETIDLWFQSQVKSKYTVIANRSAYVIGTFTRFILVKIQSSIFGFAWVRSIENILTATGLILTYQSTGNSLKAWRFNSIRARLLLQESWPLILTSLAIIIYMKIDVIMLGKMAGNEAVGVYSAAVRLSESWYFIGISLVSSAFPSIIKSKDVSEKLYYKKLQKLFYLMNLTAYAIAIPMTLISVKLVVFLYGQEYEPSGYILAVHIWASVFVFMGVVQNPWNIAEGLTKLYLQRTLIGAIINVLLNFWLIPLYSGMGAAIATVVSYGCSAFLSNAFDSRTIKIFIIQANSLILRK